VKRLQLPQLRRPTARQPLRILEVGVGTGANLPLLERHLPRGLDIELWGLDLSAGMIERCRRRSATHAGRRVRLLLADAHALPFRDAWFDRVFHVGGIGGYRDPRTALGEMGRVARPGTPIVVVDEQLDPQRTHSLYHRLMFRALTFYDPAPAAPRIHLPDGAADVTEEQVSRFYYCLTFHMPKSNSRRRKGSTWAV
jgi:ubiquinone/menaquinone biosynthesis C-methylase UbiE